MQPSAKSAWIFAASASLLLLLWGLIGCGQPAPASSHDELAVLTLPEVQAAELNGRALRVVATTSIIGDIVGQVGGEAIGLTTLMGPGQDPHSYEPSANDLTNVAQADVIFVNGWDLEEALVNSLATIGAEAIVAPVSANITPRAFGGADHAADEDHAAEAEHANEAEDKHEHGGADPHTWFAVSNVEQWTSNVAQVLGALDPKHRDAYAANAAAYLAQLEELQTDITAQMASIPAEKRVLVTNHESFGYFADAYGFETLGTVIPAMSTLAEPSASDVADLIGVMAVHNLCTIFTETTVSDKLAQTVAAELSGCETVSVVPLYTGSVGPAGSGADSYIGMMRTNVAAIIAGLQ